MSHAYYQSRKQEIIRQIEESLALVAPEFARKIPEIDLADLRPQLFTEINSVIDALPWVGGDEGRMTGYFEQNAGVIALGRVLLAQGLEWHTVADLLTRTFLARLTVLDEKTRFEMGRNFMSQASQAQLRVLAEQSQARENAGDFVYTFVDAGTDEVGHDFDFGLDYQECGFCKLCAATGDGAILPMICGMDEESYALRGIRLTRTQTLASGATHCNFRYSLLPEAQEDARQPDDK